MYFSGFCSVFVQKMSGFCSVFVQLLFRITKENFHKQLKINKLK